MTPPQASLAKPPSSADAALYVTRRSEQLWQEAAALGLAESVLARV